MHLQTWNIILGLLVTTFNCTHSKYMYVCRARSSAKGAVIVCTTWLKAGFESIHTLEYKKLGAGQARRT